MAVRSQVVHAQALAIANARGVLIDDLDAAQLAELYVAAEQVITGTKAAA